MADRIPTSRVRRGAKLGKLAATQARRGAGLKLTAGRDSGEAAHAEAERAVFEAADDLVTVLGSMKGLAMKAGQTLSMIDLSIIPEQYRDRFRDKVATLCDQAPQLPFDRMRAVFESDLGRSLDEAFDEFDPAPIAAASIGQVYRARLADGRPVAVKIQYPGIDTAVRADVKNLSLALRMSRSIAPALADSALMNELAIHFAAEVDYRIEARHQTAVAEAFRGHPFILVPNVVPELCGAHVLVSDHIEASGFDDMVALPQDDRDRLGEIIFRFYMGSMARHGRFPGDPHPGNVLLDPDGKVVFLDYGLFKEMAPASVTLENECARAACEYRGADLRQLLVDYGVLKRDSDVTPDECLRYLREVSAWYLTDAEIGITGETATNAVLATVDPRRGYFDRWRRERLSADFTFARRVEYAAVGLLGRLGARANWHRIAREWLYGDMPRTELGELEQRWRSETDICRIRH
ncbi:putative ATP-binding protein [Nocardia nova SH22a]|uniref:Putative ATP-binding protein n=1 Tax=Nocardia nova SH22a TaxID=1415166 RepID=W5TL14_9NOCA|nr:AarF/ABC1/UbiB kinase family protein [Nocardia nova]AHH19947.1 putative ATP-binding protein [Nocardia nova SH22a]